MVGERKALAMQNHTRNDATARPVFQTCYICGREYGSRSLDIHMKQCAQLWEKTESKKPLRERKPLPAKPKEITAADIEAQARKRMCMVSDSLANLLRDVGGCCVRATHARSAAVRRI